MAYHPVQLPAVTFIAAFLAIIGALSSFGLTTIPADRAGALLYVRKGAFRIWLSYGIRQREHVVLFIIMMFFIAGFVWDMVEAERKG